MTAAAPLGSVTKRAPPAPRVLDLGQSKGVQAPVVTAAELWVTPWVGG
jgi:hypothetical protein